MFMECQDIQSSDYVRVVLQLSEIGKGFRDFLLGKGEVNSTTVLNQDTLNPDTRHKRTTDIRLTVKVEDLR